MGDTTNPNWQSLAGDFKPSSGVKFKKGKLDSNSKSLTSDGDDIAMFAGRTGRISLDWPGYGLTGRECDSAHENARTQQVQTLNTAKEVLESWRDALKIADSRYTESDDQSIPDLNKQNQVPSIPGLNGSGLNGPGFDGSGLTDPNLNTPGLTNPDLTSPNLNDPRLTNPDLNNPRLNDPNLTNPNLTNPNLPNPHLNNPNLKQPEMPEMPGSDPGKTDLSGLKDPTKTGLSGFDPSTMQPPQGRVPDGLMTDPGRVTNGAPATGSGYGATSGAGAGSPLAAGKLPGGAAGTGGMGGMPFMPMAPMSGAGDKERESNGSDLLRGDPDDWDDEEGVTAAVLRHEGA
ncbi:hypothetical protein [Nonomuraea lactucae]|uniref:hypothetical protein n=1 Tax=Nonomuraea lactucae TaxID=2249762 RepID=UPI000DE41CA1|nr:hypothetical protein [Nonomuraea lactucae]